MTELRIDGISLSLTDIERVARGQRVALCPSARARVAATRQVVDRLVAGDRPIYGVTTGFGRLADVAVPPAAAEELQVNLVRSHAAGVGDPLPEPEVRAVILLRANALARGHSGVRPEVIGLLLDLLNAGVHPVVPSQGSLGASGDLAPLAHIALVLIGRGRAAVSGTVCDGGEALARAALLPIRLQAKEGLALINGTQAMTGIGALAVAQGLRLAGLADAVAALTTEVLRGIPDAFDERIHSARPHPGQVESARNLRAHLAGSRLTTRAGEARVQDAYALRCIPQVHGACRDALAYAAGVLRTEANSATDNPLLFGEEVLSGGNFHGQPVAIAMDLAGIALAELASISERRTERLLNPALNDGLPAFLTRNSGLHSGLMLAQYTAAALVSENKLLASPASVDSIPSSANQEDHVSMGTIAARKARTILDHTRQVLAIELICAAQAIDLRDGVSRLSPAGRRLHAAVRAVIPPLDGDRELHTDISRVATLVRDMTGVSEA
ncbi:MAG: histidine ammonia-lyase [Bacillota bacterium]